MCRLWVTWWKILAKRKLSAYNLHVRREMKAGKSMKQAARSWAGKSRTRATKKKRSPPRKPKRRRSTVAKRRKKRSRRGSRILGSIGLKGAIIGGLTYFGVSRLMPPIGGVYNPAVTKIATGLVAKSIGVPGALMAGAGLIEAVAILFGQILSGGFQLPFGGGGGAGNGGYDY